MPDDTRLLEVDGLIRALETPAAPVTAPAWPVEEALVVGTRRVAGGARTRWWAWAAAACVAGAVLLLGATKLIGTWTGAPADDISFRGAGRDTPSSVGLALILDEGDAARTLPPGETVVMGSRVYFEVDAPYGKTVHVWVEGPHGLEPIGAMRGAGRPALLSERNSAPYYQLDEPGRLHFRASTEGEGCCDPESCGEAWVEVQ
jgi:hypothetical protein